MDLPSVLNNGQTQSDSVNYWLNTIVSMFAVAYLYDTIKHWWQKPRFAQPVLPTQPLEVILERENHYHDHQLNISNSLVYIGGTPPPLDDDEYEEEGGESNENPEEPEDNGSHDSWAEIKE